MRGQYDPITESASGSVGKSDYIVGGAVIIAIIAALGILIWFVISKLTGLLPDPLATAKGAVDAATKAVTDTKNASDTSIAQAASSVTPTADQAINVSGNPYPVKTLTQTDYENFLAKFGLAGTVAQVGDVAINAAGAQPVLDAVTMDGAKAGNTVNRLGLNNEYVDLPALQKGLVTVGEGVGQALTLGQFDPIQAGFDLKQQLNNSLGVLSGKSTADLTDYTKVGKASNTQSTDPNDPDNLSQDARAVLGLE